MSPLCSWRYVRKRCKSSKPSQRLFLSWIPPKRCNFQSHGFDTSSSSRQVQQFVVFDAPNSSLQVRLFVVFDASSSSLQGHLSLRKTLQRIDQKLLLCLNLLKCFDSLRIVYLKLPTWRKIIEIVKRNFC
ncbi:uncharacterized protein [Typha angustifolia]|uniref:uncharacterized protein isoform X2 n=1 Tax=Typha angustifolia TaxID=59011 RepID=UPI003C2DC966